MLTVTLALLVAAAASAGSGTTLVGTVVSLGQPIPGAEISVTSPTVSPRNTVSRTDGSFQLPRLLPGKYVVTARLFGFCGATANITVLGSSGEVGPLVLTLRPAPRQVVSVCTCDDLITAQQSPQPPQSKTYLFRVVGPSGPVAGASIRVKGGLSATFLSGTDGSVRIPATSDQRFSVTVEHEGFMPAETDDCCLNSISTVTLVPRPEGCT